MRRHKSLIKLSREHHKGLLLAQLLKKDAPEYRGLPTDIRGKVNYAKQEWENSIQLHFEAEEKILFPLICNIDETIDKLISEIKLEHVELINLFKKVCEGTNSEEILNETGVKLENHIRKEERILFQKLQQKLDDKKLALIEEKLGSTKRNNSLRC